MKKPLIMLISSILMIGGFSLASNYTSEQRDAYNYAYSQKITTISSIDRADMNGSLTRIAMAKMISNFAINVLGLQIDTSKNCSFSDVSSSLDREYNYGATQACQLGLMGIGNDGRKSDKFYPYETVTRGQFATAFSRAISSANGDTVREGQPYYKWHLQYLNGKGIIKNINNPIPNSLERRGNVMIMMYRCGKGSNDGNVISQNKNGRYVEYYDNGKIWKISNYKNGKLDGEYIEYFKDGSIASKGSYKNGELDGYAVRYCDKGKEDQGYYIDGKCIRWEGNYENGEYIAREYIVRDYEARDYDGTLGVEILDTGVPYRLQIKITNKLESTIQIDGLHLSSVKLDESIGVYQGDNTMQPDLLSRNYDNTIDAKFWYPAILNKGDSTSVTIIAETGGSYAIVDGISFSINDNEYSFSKDTSSKTKWNNLFVKNDGNIDGTLKTYYNNGQLNKILNYKNGKLDGEYIEYFKDGSIASEGTYKNGELEGYAVGYCEKGKEDKGYYRDGKCIRWEGIYENGEYVARDYDGTLGVEILDTGTSSRLKIKITNKVESTIQIDGLHLSSVKLDESIGVYQGDNTMQPDLLSRNYDNTIDAKFWYPAILNKGDSTSVSIIAETEGSYAIVDGILFSINGNEYSFSKDTSSKTKRNNLFVKNDGNITGEYIWTIKKYGTFNSYAYRPNGTIQSAISYDDNGNKKDYISFYENGQLKEQGQYKNNEKVGEWTEYFENGEVKSKWSYISTEDLAKLKDKGVIRGPENAKLTIVEFTELLCPYCQRQSQQGTITSVLQQFPGQVNSISRPFVIHGDEALQLSSAMECVANLKPGVYYDVLDEAFGAYPVNMTGLVDIAVKNGVNEKSLQNCIDEGKYLQSVNDIMNLGSELGVNGTPESIVIDNESLRYKIIEGAYPVDTFVETIESLLN